jgi:hypothetical protein
MGKQVGYRVQVIFAPLCIEFDDYDATKPSFYIIKIGCRGYTVQRHKLSPQQRQTQKFLTQLGFQVLVVKIT